MRSINKFLVVLGLAVGSVMVSQAQQNTLSDNAPDQLTPPSTFAQVVTQSFDQWDGNGDGKLSREEIEAAVANPKVQGESAAAIAAIKKIVRGSKYTIPAITKDYLIHSPLTEQGGEDGQAEADDDSKPGQFNHAPAFQPRYLKAVRKLHHTSRTLFPQDLPSFEATHQGALGDCPFVSTVGAMVYRDPAAVKSMFTQNDNGSITVTFGGGRSIKIAHLTDADIAIWSSAGTNGLWLTVLEKAYRRMVLRTQPPRAKRADIYEKFPSTRTIEILDGHQTRKLELHKIELASLRKDLGAAVAEHRLVKAGTGAGKKTPGIPHGHAFAVLGYDKDTDMVHVWNPWGNNFSPKGLDGLQNGYTTHTGQFDIPLKDMVQALNDITFETAALERN